MNATSGRLGGALFSHVRPLQESDQSEWLRLRLALWPDHTIQELEHEQRAILARFEREPVFVAERRNGRLGGMIEVALHDTAEGCITNPVGYIEGWYVDPDLRRCGVGRRLVEAAEAWARQIGCTEMASDTTPEYTLSPLAHLRLGYRETQIPLHYCKRLSSR